MLGKRGISAIVATVLIILITIVAVVILWNIVIPMVRSEILFQEVAKFSIVVSDGYTFCDPDSEVIYIQVKQAASDLSIEEIRLILAYNGNTFSRIVDAPGPNNRRTYSFGVPGSNCDFDYVGVAPIYKNVEGPMGAKEKVPDGKEAESSPGGEDFFDVCSSDDLPDGSFCSNGICQSGVCIVAPNIYFTGITPLNGDTIGNSNFMILVNATDLGGEDVSTFIDFDNSLIGWWRMEQGNGVSFVDDSSYGNDATCGGGDCPVAVLGVMGGAYDFDRSSDDKIVVEGSGGTLTWGNFSVFAWIKVPDITVANDYYIVSQGNKCESGTKMWTFNIADDGGHVNELRFNTRAGADFDTLYSDGINLTDGLWHHVAGVRNSTHKFLYIDGVLVNSAADLNEGVVFTPTTNISIGGDPCLDTEAFNGSIDDVMIFNRALSSVEVAGLYANQSTKILENDFVDLAIGIHVFRAYAQDVSGYVNMTEERSVTVF